MSGKTPQILVIEAGKSNARYWQDLWRFRELFLFLTWRDILVRYKQTAIGILWSVLRPLLTMAVFTIVFGKIAKLPADGAVAYPLMVFAALLPWQMFANAVTESSNSVINNGDMVGKIYFPRMILPVSAVTTAVVDFLIALILFFILMVFYGVVPTPQILLLPVFITIGLGAALGAGLLISALNVSYRDFRYVVPFLIQFGLYVSPVGFSSSVVPEGWRLLYALNPMVGVIDGVRWCLLGGHADLYLPGLVLSLVMTAVLLLVGVVSFRHMERSFADRI